MPFRQRIGRPETSRIAFCFKSKFPSKCLKQFGQFMMKKKKTPHMTVKLPLRCDRREPFSSVKCAFLARVQLHSSVIITLFFPSTYVKCQLLPIPQFFGSCWKIIIKYISRCSTLRKKRELQVFFKRLF